MREGGAGRRLFAVCVAVATMIAVMPTIVARPAGAAVDPVRAHRTFACTLRSRANGRFVTAEIHDRGSSVGVLRAHASSAGVSEQFQCVALSNGWAVKSSANNRYVTAEPTGLVS